MATDRRGAAYDAWLREDPGEWDESYADENEHSLDNHCDGCGAVVSPQYRRVFGDNADRIRRCPDCSNSVDVFNAGGAKEEPNDIL